jgi:uncharacterized protein YaaW (UPF0174 family)
MSYEKEVTNGDEALLALLQGADGADVSALVDFLTDSGSGRLAMAAGVKEMLVAAKKKNRYSRDTLLLLIRELQLFGGNSIVNLVRRNGVPYVEITRDVAKYVGAKVTGTEGIEVLELKVLSRLVEKLWEKMTEQERADFARKVHADNGMMDVGLAAVLAAINKGGPGAVKAGVAGIAGIGSLLAEGAFSAGAVAVGGRAATAVLGFVGLAVAGAATIQMAAKEAYRVTLPCVAQIAYIRQKSRGTSAVQ